MEKVIHIELPRWVAIVYGILAIVLIPWIFNLAYDLPSRHLANHWDAVWVGFDVFLLVNIALTLYFIARHRVWVVVSASVLATLFIVDVWFDILTSRPGRELRVAIAFGALEILLALITFRLVFRIMHNTTPHKNVRLVTKKKKTV